MIYKNVTAVIINYQTPELTSDAVSSLKNYYPEIHLIIIDNGSRDDSISKLNKLLNNYKNVKIIPNKKNIHHGPAMHQAILLTESDYILFLDSDCKVLKGGFIEEMTNILDKNIENYAVGEIIYLNRRGFITDDQTSAIPYIRPICMMLKRNIYLNLKPFKKHGAPCLDNMLSAVNNGLKLVNFNINEYVFHVGRGTASKYGYKLGFMGKLNYLLNKLKL